jgi:hypothetical protein
MDGIALELTLDRATVAIGDRLTARVRVSNRGTTSPTWEANICGRGPAPTKVTRPWDIPAGLTWPGLAGEFKRATLEESGYVSGDEVVLGTFWDALWVDDPDMSCPGFSDERPFARGEVAEMKLAWNVSPRQGQLLRAGSATVTATFSSSSGEISASLPIEITGGPPADDWTIVDAIDAALHDSEFVSWLGARPRATWMNTGVVFWPNDEGKYPPLPAYRDATGPVVEVSLARSVGARVEYAGVVVEWGTGRILGSRFEP